MQRSFDVSPGCILNAPPTATDKVEEGYFSVLVFLAPSAENFSADAVSHHS